MKTAEPKDKGKTDYSKLTDFDLADLFLERCTPIKINGKLCYYNGKMYTELNDTNLESVILALLEKELRKIGNANRVKKVAYLINKREYPNYQPAEDSGWLGFFNGLLNISNWDYIDFNRNVANTYCLNITYDFSHHYLMNDYTNYMAEQELIRIYHTPHFDNFVRRITGGDSILALRIYEMIGYLIVPDISARAFFLLQGVPHSGKSVLGRFIEEYFPSDLVNSLDITRLGGKYLPEGMEKCRLNLSMDLADGELPSKSVAMIKMLTGGDLVTKEVKYKDAKPYRGQCKFLFSTNHKLKMKTWDKAFLERLVCIPFKYPVSKEEEDVNLLQHLEDEREAITMKALFYYRKFVANKQIFAGTGRYNPDIEFCSSESDTIKAFVEEKCVIVRPNEGATYTKDLYEAYLSFCAENSFTSNCNSNGFGERLSSLYKGRIVPARWRSENRNDRGFRGIVLVDINSNDYGYDDYDEQQYDIQVFNV